jgi:hypothetical protein
MLDSMRISPAEFLELPLEVHAVLHDVPLRDVTAIDLPRGGPGRTIADVRALIEKGPSSAGNQFVRFLFWLRWLVGRLLGWDEVRPDDAKFSYRSRLSPGLVSRSLDPPGQPEGFFALLYRLDREMLVEVRNATVHAFLASVLQPTAAGYRIYWAVYVLPVSRLTNVYMAAIEPFRRFVVYPSIMRGLRRRWDERYATS